MGRKAARRGTDFERAVARDLAARGWYWIRSAGSHGAADVAALRAGRAWLVQAKVELSGMRPPDRRALIEAARVAGAEPVVASRPRRGAIEYLLLLGEGPRDLSPLDPGEKIGENPAAGESPE